MSDRSYIFGNYSHVGIVRTENQDYFGFFSTVFGELFVVCDGVGGSKGGSVASRTAVESIKQYFEETDMTDPVIVLGKSLQYADQAIMELSEKNDNLYGMGTTCVALLLQQGTDPKGWVAHAGDSRMYRIRRNRVEQLTKDHSRVQEMVDHGILTSEQAKEHQDSHFITRSLGGTTPGVEPDVSPVEICKGDRYILCSDGVSGLVADDVLLNLSNKQKAPQDMAEALVNLANDLGGEDNSTTQIIDIKLGPKPPISKPSIDSKKFPIPLIASIGGTLAIIIAAILIWKPFGKQVDIRELAEPLVASQSGTIYPDEPIFYYSITQIQGDGKVACSLNEDDEARVSLYDEDLEIIDSLNVIASEDSLFLNIPVDGEYYLSVQAGAPESAISYTLLYSTLIPEPEVEIVDTTEVILGRTYYTDFTEDQLTREYVLQVEEGKTYRIEKSSEFLLLSSNGEFLEAILANDSIIEFQANSEQYFITASIDSSAQIGSPNFIVSEKVEVAPSTISPDRDDWTFSDFEEAGETIDDESTENDDSEETGTGGSSDTENSESGGTEETGTGGSSDTENSESGGTEETGTGGSSDSENSESSGTEETGTGGSSDTESTEGGNTQETDADE